MQQGIKLTREQIFFLAFIGVLGNILYNHTWIDNDTDRAAWVATLSGILLIIPCVMWILYLGKSYPESTIFDIIEAGMGKYVSKATMMIFIFINIILAVTQLNMFTEMIKVFFLQYTPSWIIMFILILTGTLFVNSGIVVLGRVFELLTILGLLNYFFSFIFAFPNQFHIEYVLPIFDTSIMGFIKGTIFIAGNASELLLLLMIIIRFIPDPLKHYKWVVSGIVLSGVIFSLAIMVIIGIMSPELAKRIAFGGVNASKIIQIGEYVRGLEIFVFGTYQFLVIGEICLCMYCAWESGKRIFNNRKPGVQLLLIAFLMFLPAAWINSYSKAYFLSVFVGNYIILPFSLAILLLATISIMIIKKRTGSGSC
jgi:spore germination protein KB